MPFFGVDDILFLLASTTALLWAKRADIVEASVYASVHLITDDAEEAARRAKKAAEAHGGTPALLLRGFDLEAEEAAPLTLRDCWTRPARGLSENTTATTTTSRVDAFPCRDDFISQEDAALMSAPLIKESVHAQFRETPLVYQVPQVPHRHYNPRRRQRHIAWLATASEEEVRTNISRYTVPEAQSLFSKMERENLWESVIHVSYGIEQAGEELRYLTLHNVECAIRTLLNTAHPDAALVYYFRFGEDVLVADDILVALFHACRNDEQLSMELCHVLEPFRARWTPTVYACCLTTTARHNYAAAMALYEAYMTAQKHQKEAEQGPLRRVLAASSLLRETGVVAPQESLRLNHLYHIIIPLVVEHDPDSVEKYVDDMFANDPQSAPDVLLRCLGFPHGHRVVLAYAKELQSLPLTEGAAAFPTRGTVGELALYLYKLKPSAMNMNSLLRLLTVYTATQPSTATANEPQAANPETVNPVACDIPLGTAKWTLPPCPSMASLCSGTSLDLTRLLQQVPLHSELNATVLARTITEHHASWFLATQFLSVMLRRKCFTVVPSIARHVARQGRWATASRSMAVYLSNQRSLMTKPEATLCVEASVYAGQWSSALFWVERAHAAGLALEPSTYDLVLAASRHTTFESAERVMATMHGVGASCSERGVVSFIETAAHQGKVTKAFQVLQHHSNVQWTP